MTSGTREAILDAAITLLGRRGAATTYDAVAKCAGVSRQTVYTHFPTRADLLVATADYARLQAGADERTRGILEAPTAVDALRALVDFHVAFTPQLLPILLAVERERAADADLEASFGRRAVGRRQLAHLVATRLGAEGDLAPPWTVQTTADLLATLCSGTSTAQLLHGVGWSVEELRDRLLLLFTRTLLIRRDHDC